MTAITLGIPTVRDASPSRSSAGAPVGVEDRPEDDRLLDRFGRVATDLRVSLTDKCNLRCSYCMPAEGLDWLPTEATLDDDEVIRMIRIAVERLGVTEVRFTGGEPLLRRDLEQIVAATSSLRTRAGTAPMTSLTTNGLGLARRAAKLRAAGLDRANVSLDTLDPARYAAITRRDRFQDVIAGLAAAREAGLGPLKVNAVLLPGVNDDEAAPLLRWALEHGYQLRFIEQMPLDAGGTWDRNRMITADQILGSLAEAFHLTGSDPDTRGAAPAQTWTVRDSPTGPVLGTVGVIASVTRPFCGDCDRTRLTADGQMRDCLFAHGETDLRALLRGGAGDEELATVWRHAMWGKRAGHGIDDGSFLQPARPMSSIGG